MTQTTTERETPRLKARYRSELEQRLKDELALGNIMQVPRPLKVVVNMGIGEAIKEARLLDGAVRDLTQITGQKPMVT
ncbi:MAG TPA: 50S ribosomal protein L5, partial [Actinomycetes bacterium]|nr:50S ribosomal protein L5 [Actinomycetes bacterium]